MKDLSHKHNRTLVVYPRKRPSPNGVAKKTPARRSPRSAKAASLQQRRDLQALALRKEAILLEEEYRDEIRRYMHEMEVVIPSHPSPAAHIC